MKVKKGSRFFRISVEWPAADGTPTKPAAVDTAARPPSLLIELVYISADTSETEVVFRPMRDRNACRNIIASCIATAAQITSTLDVSKIANVLFDFGFAINLNPKSMTRTQDIHHCMF